MGVSDVLATTMAILRNRGIGLVGIWLAFLVLVIILGAVAFGVIGAGALAAGGMGMSGDGLGAGLGLGMLGAMLVFYLAYILIYMAQSLAMAHYASPLVEPDIGTSFSAGFRGALTMVGVTVLLLIVYFAVALVMGLASAALSSVGDLLGAGFAILILPVAIYLMCRLSILLPVVAVDGVRNPVTAIGRTWALTRGNALAIFLSLLAFVVVAIVVFGVMFVFFAGSMQGLESSMATGAGPGAAISGMLGGAGMVFVWKFLLKPLGGAWGIYELLPAFIFSSIVIIVVSLLTKKPDEAIQKEFDSVSVKA